MRKQTPRRAVRATGSLIKETFIRWMDDGAFEMSASIAFYAAFSMGPGFLILIWLLGAVYGVDTNAEIQAQITEFVGADAARLIAQAVTGTRNRLSLGGWVTLLTVLMMLLGMSATFRQLLAAVNRAWRVTPRPDRGMGGILRDRFWPFVMVGLGSGVLLVSTLVSTAIHASIRFVPRAATVTHYVDLWLSFAVVTVLFALLYKFLPDAHIAWSDVWVGALVTAIFFAAGKYLFSLYLGTRTIETIFGAVGSFLIILAWVYFSSSILLLGAEFTHIYAERHGHSVRPKAHAMRID